MLSLNPKIGLSSELFYKAGLEIHGIDFSPQMLSLCRAKQMTADPKEHDLSCTPYPYPDTCTDHGACTGVTHLFEDMTPIFREFSRIIKPGGTFSFVAAHCDECESRVKEVAPRIIPVKTRPAFSVIPPGRFKACSTRTGSAKFLTCSSGHRPSAGTIQSLCGMQIRLMKVSQVLELNYSGQKKEKEIL